MLLEICAGQYAVSGGIHFIAIGAVAPNCASLPLKSFPLAARFPEGRTHCTEQQAAFPA